MFEYELWYIKFIYLAFAVLYKTVPHDCSHFMSKLERLSLANEKIIERWKIDKLSMNSCQAETSLVRHAILSLLWWRSLYAWLCKIAGAIELAAVSVALSVFNTVTKICNSPLLAVTTSLVATSEGSAEAGEFLSYWQSSFMTCTSLTGLYSHLSTILLSYFFKLYCSWKVKRWNDAHLPYRGCLKLEVLWPIPQNAACRIIIIACNNVWYYGSLEKIIIAQEGLWFVLCWHRRSYSWR